MANLRVCEVCRRSFEFSALNRKVCSDACEKLIGVAGVWIKIDCGYRCDIGIFRLSVWPHHPPFSAWAGIPEDGGSSVLPSSDRDIPDLESAKKWIEDEIRAVCTKALEGLARG